jgi:hypothetical protein
MPGRNNKGYALAMLIIFIAVAIILGAALLFISSNEFNFAIREENRLRAYYIAQAGIDGTREWLETAAFDDVADVVNGNRTNTTAATSFGDGEFYIYFGGDKVKPVVYSRGHYKTGERVISLDLQKRTYFDAAVTVTHSLNMANPNTHIYGSVIPVSDGTSTASITGYTGLSNITGGILPPVNMTFPSPHTSVTETEIDDYIDMTGSYDYEFVIPNHDDSMEVKIDEIDLNGASYNINVSGDSGDIFELYVNDINFKGNWTCDPGVKFVLYILDSGTLEFQTGQATFEGNIYAPYADLTLKANMTNTGGIVAQNLSIESGGSTAYDSSTAEVFPEDMGLGTLGYHTGKWRNE